MLLLVNKNTIPCLVRTCAVIAGRSFHNGLLWLWNERVCSCATLVSQPEMVWLWNERLLWLWNERSSCETSVPVVKRVSLPPPLPPGLWISTDFQWIWLDFLHVDWHLYLYYLQSTSRRQVLVSWVAFIYAYQSLLLSFLFVLKKDLSLAIKDAIQVSKFAFLLMVFAFYRGIVHSTSD